MSASPYTRSAGHTLPCSKPSQDFGGNGRASQRGLSSKYSETRPRSLDPPGRILWAQHGFETPLRGASKDLRASRLSACRHEVNTRFRTANPQDFGRGIRGRASAKNSLRKLREYFTPARLIRSKISGRARTQQTEFG